MKYHNNNVLVRDVILPDDIKDVQRLWLEYLTWGNHEMQERYGVHPHNPEQAVQQDIASIHKFQPPYGRLMVAVYKGSVCGLGSLKKITDQIGEIKRMYVDPSYRGLGAGQAILETILKEASEAGYRTIRLDSPKFMEAAHALYRKIGFKPIAAYAEVEIPPEFHEYMLFMELDIS